MTFPRAGRPTPSPISQWRPVSSPVGAIAVGAIAIGSMAIGALAIKKVKLRDVEIDTLTVRRFRVLEPDAQQPATTADAAPETNGEAAPRPAPRRRRPRKPVPN
jgi:hypothetical protein